MIEKAANFEWDPEQERALQQAHNAVQAALSYGPCDPADPLILELSVVENHAMWCMAIPSRRNTIYKTQLLLVLGDNRGKTPGWDYGISKYDEARDAQNDLGSERPIKL